MSISGDSARSGASSSAARSASSRIAPSITTICRPLRNGGSSGSGGKLITRIEVVTESGGSRVHSAQAREHLGRALAVPEQHAGVRGRRIGIRSSSIGDDDAEVAAAAANRPEQVGVGVGICPHQGAVGGDDVDGAHGSWTPGPCLRA